MLVKSFFYWATVVGLALNCALVVKVGILLFADGYGVTALIFGSYFAWACVYAVWAMRSPLQLAERDE